MEKEQIYANKTPLISVIVPVYKVEQFICRCVDSILNQTYPNLEIILVDDGSPDRCGEICDEYAEKDSRIRVIHQENGGLSAARNAGLDICTGEYIAFVDSDDYIVPEMYKIMLESTLEHNTDICVCQWQYEFADGRQVIDLRKTDLTILEVKNTKTFAHYLYKGSYENITTVAVWNKLYRGDIFTARRFSGRFMEDEALHTELFAENYSICVIPQLFYIYCENQDSLTNKPFREESLRYLQILKQRVMLHREDIFMWAHSAKLYCNLYIEYYYKAKDAGISMPDRTDFSSFAWNLTRTHYSNLKFCIRMLLFWTSPAIYRKLLMR